MEHQMEVSMGPVRAPGRTRHGSGGVPADLASAVSGLSTRDANTLNQQWLTVFGAAPPSGLRRAFTIRALAYRMQEQALGGLTPATRRILQQVAHTPEDQRP